MFVWVFVCLPAAVFQLSRTDRQTHAQRSIFCPAQQIFCPAPECNEYKVGSV